MKQSINSIAVLVLMFTSTIARGQDEGSFPDMYLKGKWTASCPPEILARTSMHECGLCPFIVNPDNKSQGAVKDIEINFLADSIAFNQNGLVTSVPFKRNPDNHSFSFTLNTKQYNFRVFFDGKRRIVEDSDGMLMVLEKIK